jgi:hypothetical protein
MESFCNEPSNSFIFSVYANGYLASPANQEEIIEEDWAMVDQTQSSFSQEDSEELIAYEPEFVEDME